VIGLQRSPIGTLVRVLYSVASIEPAVNEQINVSFTSENDRDRTLTALANRRFLKAADA
jgi:hypothetical protein